MLTILLETPRDKRQIMLLNKSKTENQTFISIARNYWQIINKQLNTRKKSSSYCIWSKATSKALESFFLKEVNYTNNGVAVPISLLWRSNGVAGHSYHYDILTNIGGHQIGQHRNFICYLQHCQLYHQAHQPRSLPRGGSQSKEDLPLITVTSFSHTRQSEPVTKTSVAIQQRSIHRKDFCILIAMLKYVSQPEQKNVMRL